MKTLLASTIFLLLLGAMIQGAISFDKRPRPFSAIPSFESLPAGHTLLVEYTSVGCFHHTRVDLAFRKGEQATVTAVEIREDWDSVARRVVETERIGLGMRLLTDIDIMRFDQLLSFYRGTKASSSGTTSDTVTVRQMYMGRTLATVGFSNRDIAADDIEQLVTFSEIVRDFEKMRYPERFDGAGDL